MQRPESAYPQAVRMRFLLKISSLGDSRTLRTCFANVDSEKMERTPIVECSKGLNLQKGEQDIQDDASGCLTCGILSSERGRLHLLLYRQDVDRPGSTRL